MILKIYIRIIKRFNDTEIDKSNNNYESEMIMIIVKVTTINNGSPNYHCNDKNNIENSDETIRITSMITTSSK